MFSFTSHSFFWNFVNWTYLSSTVIFVTVTVLFSIFFIAMLILLSEISKWWLVVLAHLSLLLGWWIFGDSCLINPCINSFGERKKLNQNWRKHIFMWIIWYLFWVLLAQVSKYFFSYIFSLCRFICFPRISFLFCGFHFRLKMYWLPFSIPVFVDVFISISFSSSCLSPEKKGLHWNNLNRNKLKNLDYSFLSWAKSLKMKLTQLQEWDNKIQHWLCC